MKTKTVESETSPISIDYSGPIGKSFELPKDEEGKVKDRRKLEIAPGEKKEFSDSEAEFLLKRYPFLEQVGSTEEEEVVEEVQLGEPKAPATEEIPTNYMKLKAFAKEKGVEVEKTDKANDILAKLKDKGIS